MILEDVQPVLRSPDSEFSLSAPCVLSGNTGRGKTHLAIAIAYRAIQNGFDALFCTAAALIDTLSEAASCGKLRERLHDYVSPDVLVIGEVGYLSYGPDAANVLFHVVNERHQKTRAMLFTTNKSTKSGEAFCMTMTWQTSSSIGFSNAVEPSNSTAHPTAPSTSALTGNLRLGYQPNRPEFLEFNRQNFRNPQLWANRQLVDGSSMGRPSSRHALQEVSNLMWSRRSHHSGTPPSEDGLGWKTIRNSRRCGKRRWRLKLPAAPG
ncbi:MAG TPA: ATP-binding protein [Candidatus Methanoperedens sp.]|nr:ATP-binding protein [Candidatus Methanoperedens sp.]